MRAADPGAIWWPSSPSPGKLSFGDAWHDDSSGDMHYWSVWHEGRDFDHYRDVRPRFCSEFGFQSFPSSAVIRNFVDRRRRSQHRLAGHGVAPEECRRQCAHRRDHVPLFPLPEGFREFRLSEPDPAGAGDQDRGRILAVAEAALHGHALLAAQRHLAGRVLVEPRSWRRLEGAALHGAALLPAGRGVHRSRQGVGARRRSSAVNDGNADVTVEARLRVVETGGSIRTVASLSGAVCHRQSEHARPCRARRDRRGQRSVPRLAGIRRRCRAQSFLAAALQGAAARAARTVAATPNAMAAASACRSPRKSLAFHVNVEADVAGHFSDNAFDILPGEIVTVTFTPDDPAAPPVGAEAFVLRDLHSSYASRSI